MIPKRLIFIWLGSELPNYGKFCIDAFRNVNPDFEIMFVNEIDVEHPKNEDVKECLKIINDDQLSIYKHLTTRNWVKEHLNSKIGRLTALSDALRFCLLNKYGGIYLDLDTFPVNPFDDKLLNYENGFVVNYKPGRYDIFFIGLNKGCVDDGLVRLPDSCNKKWFNKKVQPIQYYEKFYQQIYMKKYDDARNKFFNLNLTFGESAYPKRLVPQYYIDHFRKESWR